MRHLKLKALTLGLVVLSGALPVVSQQTQATPTSTAPQPTQPTTAQQAALQAAAKMPNGHIPPSGPPSAIDKMSAICKFSDPPPNTPVLSAAPDSAATNSACDPSAQAPPIGHRTDAEVAEDAIIEDQFEKITGVPASAESAYQKGATAVGSAALNAAGNAMDSEFLARVAGFVASDAFSGALGVTFSSSQAGYDPAFDAMTPEQYQAYQANQFQKLQSDFNLQNPGAFCLVNPNDSRCGGQGLATPPSDSFYAAACSKFRSLLAQYSSGPASAQTTSVLQFCQQYSNGSMGQYTSPTPQSAGGYAGSTQQGRSTSTTPPPPKKPASPPCGHPPCTAP